MNWYPKKFSTMNHLLTFPYLIFLISSVTAHPNFSTPTSGLIKTPWVSSKPLEEDTWVYPINSFEGLDFPHPPKPNELESEVELTSGNSLISNLPCRDEWTTIGLEDHNFDFFSGPIFTLGWDETKTTESPSVPEIHFEMTGKAPFVRAIASEDFRRQSSRPHIYNIKTSSETQDNILHIEYVYRTRRDAKIGANDQSMIGSKAATCLTEDKKDGAFELEKCNTNPPAKETAMESRYDDTFHSQKRSRCGNVETFNTIMPLDHSRSVAQEEHTESFPQSKKNKVLQQTINIRTNTVASKENQQGNKTRKFDSRFKKVRYPAYFFLCEIGKKYLALYPSLQIEVDTYFTNLSKWFDQYGVKSPESTTLIQNALEASKTGIVTAFLGGLRILENPSGDSMEAFLNRGWKFLKEHLFERWKKVDYKEPYASISSEGIWHESFIYDPPRLLGYLSSLVRYATIHKTALCVHVLIEWARNSVNSKITDDRLAKFESFFQNIETLGYRSEEISLIFKGIYEDSSFCDDLGIDFSSSKPYSAKPSWIPFQVTLLATWRLKSIVGNRLYSSIHPFFHELKWILIRRYLKCNYNPGILGQKENTIMVKNTTNDSNNTEEDVAGPKHVCPKGVNELYGGTITTSPLSLLRIIKAVDAAQEQTLVGFMEEVHSKYKETNGILSLEESLSDSWDFFRSFFKHWEDMDMNIENKESVFGIRKNIRTTGHIERYEYRAVFQGLSNTRDKRRMETYAAFCAKSLFKMWDSKFIISHLKKQKRSSIENV